MSIAAALAEASGLFSDRHSRPPARCRFDTLDRVMLARLRLLYLVLSSAFVAWCLYRLLSVPAELRNPNPMGLVYCLALFVAIPCLGYILLFKVVARRWLRR